MVKNNIDVFGIAETNTHWNNENIFRSSSTMIKPINNKAHLSTSDASIKWNKKYKPDRKSIITSANITQQIKEKENNNPLGRW